MAQFDGTTSNIPVERQIKFRATGDRIWDLDELHLTRVHSGDMDNGNFVSFLDTNPTIKKQMLQKYCKYNFEKVLEQKIFGQDVTDDELRNISFMLTIYDACITVLRGGGILCSTDEMYFAALVNYNCSKGTSKNRIRSYAALMEIKQSEMAAGDGSLNYSEYLIMGTNGDFDNEYVSIKLPTNNAYSSDIMLELPIIKCRFGRFRFATERIPGMMSWADDPDKTKLTVPPHIWMEMIKEGVSNRLTAKFFNGEAKSLAKIVDLDTKYVDEVCDMNDFRVALAFINAYQMDINDDNELELHNTNELPDINKVNSLKWVEIREGSGKWALASNTFYVVKLIGTTVQVRMYR